MEIMVVETVRAPRKRGSCRATTDERVKKKQEKINNTQRNEHTNENDKGNTSDLFYLVMNVRNEMDCNTNIDDEKYKIANEKNRHIQQQTHTHIHAECCTIEWSHTLREPTRRVELYNSCIVDVVFFSTILVFGSCCLTRGLCCALYFRPSTHFHQSRMLLSDADHRTQNINPLTTLYVI